MQISNPPIKTQSGPPLGGTSGDWRRRFFYFHAPLAFVSALVIFLWMTLPLFASSGHQRGPQADRGSDHQGQQPANDHQSRPRTNDHQSRSQGGETLRTEPSEDHAQNQGELQNRSFMARFTTASGYVALGLLAITLLIGPINLALRRRNPTSSYLRRDTGTWTAILNVIHVAAGLFVHGPAGSFGERVARYFFTQDGRPLVDSFGLGNWTGLAATILVLGLLAISNDVSLRKLTTRRWKWLQRLNYLLFVLVAAHAIYYGALLRVTSISTLLLGLIAILVLVGQAAGVWLWRRSKISV